jgi:hypothetical protein
MKNKVYIIKLDSRTVASVLEFQLYRTKWLIYFGGREKVDEFIKNYDGNSKEI